MLTANPDTINGLTFDQEKHLYFYKGELVPNVTRLLQEYRLIDFTGIPADRLEYKRALGTAVHYAIHLWENDNLDESSLDERIKPHVDAYKKFREITGFEPRFSELRLFSKKWRFAGTLDFQGPFMWNGKEVESIIDAKCVWGMYHSTGPQIAAYELAFNETFPEIKNKARFALQLKDDGNYNIEPFTDPNDKNTFLACLHLHHWRAKNGLIKQEKPK